MKENRLESAGDQSFDLSVAHLWLLPRNRRQPRRARLTEEIKEPEALSHRNEQKKKRLPVDKTTPRSRCSRTGNGGFEGFLFQGIPAARDGCTCERGLCCWKELFKYLYSPSLLVSCSQMKSS